MARRSRSDSGCLMLLIFLAVCSFLIPGAALIGELSLLCMLLDEKKYRTVRLGSIIVWTLFGIASMVLILYHHPYDIEWVLFALLIVTTVALVGIYVAQKLGRFVPKSGLHPLRRSSSQRDAIADPLDPHATASGGMSLYDALRLPGDPDPAYGTSTVFVDTSPQNTDASLSVTSLDASEDTDAWESDLLSSSDAEADDPSVSPFFLLNWMNRKDADADDETDDADADETDDALSFLFSNWSGDRSDAYEDDPDYSWEMHCEYCGELLEDCECDHRHESRRDVNFGFCDCGDADCDDYEGGNSGQNSSKRLADFDRFSSF